MKVLNSARAKNVNPGKKHKVYVSCEISKEFDDSTLRRFAENYAEKEDVEVFWAPWGTPVSNDFLIEFSRMEYVIFIMNEAALSPNSRVMRTEMPLAISQKKSLIPTDDVGPVADIFKTCCDYIPEDWDITKSERYAYFTLMHALTDYGRVQVLKKNYERALKVFDKAYEYATLEQERDYADPEAIDSVRVTAQNRAECANALGEAEIADESFYKASIACEQMLGISRNSVTLKNYAKCLMSWCILLKKLGDREKAERYWEIVTDLIFELNLEHKDMELLPLAVITAVRIGEMYDTPNEPEKYDREKVLRNYSEAITRFQIIRLIGDFAKEDLLQEMFSVTARLAQLEFEMDMPDKAEMHQSIARDIMKELAEESKKKMEREKEKRHNTITIIRKIK